MTKRKKYITRKKYDDNPKKCLHCENNIPYEKRRNQFCGHSCFASYANVGVRRHGKPPANCKNCGKQTDSYKRVYCGHKCQNIYQHQRYIERWLAGEIPGTRGGESISIHVKQYMFEKHDNKCELCGWKKVNSYTGKIPLTIHHIDGQWDNNDIDNLQLLCPCCHALTPTYGSLNRGNGRIQRLQKIRNRKNS